MKSAARRKPAVAKRSEERFVLGPAEAENLLGEGISRTELFRIVAPQRTLNRRKQNNQKLSAAESDRVLRVRRILRQAERVFGAKEKAHRWLRKPCRALENAVPMELLVSETGAHLVEEELHAIDHGVYA